MKRVAYFLFAAAAIGWMLGCGGAGNTSKDDSAPLAARPSGTTTTIKGFNDYSVNVERSGELTCCDVTFNSLPPTSGIAAEVVRNAVEDLVTKDRDRAILAMAFNVSGDVLPDTQYGGALVYKPADGQIRTMDERRGLETVESDEGSYFVKIKDGKTAEGITPERRWYNVSIVFQNRPSSSEARAAVLKESDKLKSRGLDINLFIYTGDKSNKITWKQIQAPNGNFMAIDYVAATGEVSPN